MLTYTTELDAVNTMLFCIGEAPVNTLEDNGLIDAVLARNVLATVSREVQSKGWHFNTEKDYTVTPTTPAGELVLPKTVLRCDSVEPDHLIDVVVRGNRLYDRRNHTYKFTNAMKVDMIVLLSHDDLPEPARQYITIKAARRFQQGRVGSDLLNMFSERDEVGLLVTLQEMEAENADYNMLSDNYSVARVLDR